MKGLTILLVLFTFNIAHAGGNNIDPAELTDAALIATTEAIADELDANNHSQEIMNMVYNRARLVRKKLNSFASKIDGLEEASDDDILPLLQDIVTALDMGEHDNKLLAKIKHHLDQSLEKLQENRELPTEIAVLSFDDSSLFDFGNVLFNIGVSRQLSITNSGNGAATILGESTMVDPYSFDRAPGDPSTFPGRDGTCGTVIVAGETCEVDVLFYPRAPGIYNGRITLDYFDGVSNQSTSRDLTGRGY